VRDCSWILRRKDYFKNVLPNNFKCCSNRTDHLPGGGYNCIAWAAGKTDKWWWPTPGDPDVYWPIPIDPVDPVTLTQFILAFESEGYSVCRHGRFENGYEKIAIFVDQDGEPQHAARMLPAGTWTSKMGAGEDIEHNTVNVVEGPMYGTTKAFLKRRNQLCKRPNRLVIFFSALKRTFGML
jgi:hypothetical protein